MVSYMALKKRAFTVSDSWKFIELQYVRIHLYALLIWKVALLQYGVSLIRNKSFYILLYNKCFFVLSTQIILFFPEGC